jgi:hypothetical protein
MNTAPLTEKLAIPVVLWAEIAGTRYEAQCEITINVGRGYCPELAKQTLARPTAQALANASIKTGWNFKEPI